MRRTLLVITSTVCALVLVAGLLVVAYSLGARQSSPSLAALGGLGSSSSASASRLPPNVEELYQLILGNAVDAPEPDELAEAAIQGMLEQLDDPYAEFYDSAAFADFNELLEGRFSGVGLALEETPEGATVVTVFPDTPAEEAGAEVGERIVSVDGEDVTDIPLEQIVALVTGEAGTDVTVGFEDDDGTVQERTMTRADIDIPIVEAELLDDGAGHVTLYSFNQHAGDDIRREVDDLLEDGATGIILDLRGNPGGLLDQAVDVTSVFVDGEEVVSVQESDGDLRSLTADDDDALTDVPLVVLVNEGSASASEIVAGAIQDLDRGPVVGTTTFGKGTVQTVRNLTDDTGAKFTTAAYFTPSGDSIEGSGVQPDVATSEDLEEQLSAAQAELSDLVAQAAG